MRSLERRGILFGSICAIACASACFAGYDSRWGEAKRAQARAASETAPAAIASSAEPESASEPGQDVRTFRVRLRPNQHYLTQTIDVPKQVHDLVDDANRVLAPLVGLRLEVESIRPWSLDDDDSLEQSLRALKRDDDAKDAELVVGLIGALPRPSDSFHDVGMANMLGRYIVIRATGRLAEDRSIDSAFDQLSDDERARLLRTRKRHRALAVLLHEIGHCLGALHEDDRASLMNPVYSPTMRVFGDGSAALMRIAVDETDRIGVAQGQLGILEQANASRWPPAERSDEMAYLKALIDAKVQPPSSQGLLPNEGRSDPASDLPGEARERLARAVALLRVPAIALAYEMAHPLFATYPESVQVQDLRCQLATLRFLERRELLAECASYSRLTGDAG